LGERHPELETLLPEILAQAQNAHPELSLPIGGFLDYLGERISDPDSVCEELPRLLAADLYLAYGCSLGDPASLARFALKVEPRVWQALARIEADRPALEDIWQTVKGRILVPGPDGPAGIVGYAGRGRLASWVQVTAMRAAFRALGKQRVEKPLEEHLLGLLASPGEDPERAYLKSLCRSEATSAVAEAVRELSPRERNLLRHHLLDQLSIDRIGALYHVHRSTAARWVERAKAKVVRGTRAALTDQMDIGDSEYESVLNLVRSELGPVLGEILAAPTVTRPEGVPRRHT
jgi:RNA polymerase sigma-70 factor (ECF subfamily)